MLHLGGNKFESLPSLNQLSQLAHLELNHCEMLRELPELPSGIRRLFANDCVSLRVSADQFAMCKFGYFWFQNCRKLLDYGDNEILANTLLHQKHEIIVKRYSYISENIILPGRAIPEWFCNHTFSGHSVLLKLPQNPKIKVYSFFVILEVVSKVKSFNFPSWDSEILHREKLRWSGLQHNGPITDVGVRLSFKEPGDYYSMQKDVIYLWDTDRITGLEHTIMGCRALDPLNWGIDCRWKKRYGIEVGIKSLSPDTVMVKKWGVRLVFKDEDEDEEDEEDALGNYFDEYKSYSNGGVVSHISIMLSTSAFYQKILTGLAERTLFKLNSDQTQLTLDSEFGGLMLAELADTSFW
ncbi:hypothetical protein LguiA_007196 [Lonicera macranthoides]